MFPMSPKYQSIIFHNVFQPRMNVILSRFSTIHYSKVKRALGLMSLPYLKSFSGLSDLLPSDSTYNSQCPIHFFFDCSAPAPFASIHFFSYLGSLLMKLTYFDRFSASLHFLASHHSYILVDLGYASSSHG